VNKIRWPMPVHPACTITDNRIGALGKFSRHRAKQNGTRVTAGVETGMDNRLFQCLRRYGVAVLAVGCAALLTLFLQPFAQTSSPLFFAAVLASTWYGGLGPGLLAIVLSTLGLEYFFLSDVHVLSPEMSDVARLVVFILVAFFTGSIQAARLRAEESLAQALSRERQARAEVETADRNKDQFIAMLGHELRTPLANIHNTLEVFRQRSPNAVTLAWGQGILERQVRYMSRLLEDVFDVSCIERGKMHLCRERLDLIRVLQAVADDQRKLFEDAGLRLQVELSQGPVWVRADATRLAQVVSNLLQNARKFTDPGGSVTLRSTVAEDGQQAVTEIEDTGIGIEPRMLSKIFQMFTQAKGHRDHSSPGLGLGLALVKGVVEMHGGKVWAASAGPGQGATFALSLPMEPVTDSSELLCDDGPSESSQTSRDGGTNTLPCPT
jgi:signal transduction histidine kinase